MIVTNRDGSTKFVEGPDEEQMNENVKFLLSRSKKKKGKLNKKVDLNPEDFVVEDREFVDKKREYAHNDPFLKDPNAESPDGVKIRDPNNLLPDIEGEDIRWSRTETEEDYKQRVKMMNALNEQFRHEDHKMTLEEFEAKFPENYFMDFDDLDHIITERDIDRQIEHYDECVKGMHGHQPQRWAQIFGTMSGFKGKYW